MGAAWERHAMSESALTSPQELITSPRRVQLEYSSNLHSSLPQTLPVHYYHTSTFI